MPDATLEFTFAGATNIAFGATGFELAAVMSMRPAIRLEQKHAERQNRQPGTSAKAFATAPDPVTSPISTRVKGDRSAPTTATLA
jgi:hypothetical protein